MKREKWSVNCQGSDTDFQKSFGRVEDKRLSFFSANLLPPQPRLIPLLKQSEDRRARERARSAPKKLKPAKVPVSVHVDLVQPLSTDFPQCSGQRFPAKLSPALAAMLTLTHRERERERLPSSEAALRKHTLVSHTHLSHLLLPLFHLHFI